MFTNDIGRIFMGVFAAILVIFPINLYAQSPLTVQPSTGRVGVGNTNPGYTLDVTGTINATNFRGDGSQLTNLPNSGSSTAINKVTANTTICKQCRRDKSLFVFCCRRHLEHQQCPPLDDSNH